MRVGSRIDGFFSDLSTTPPFSAPPQCMAKFSAQEYGNCTYLICRTLLGTSIDHLSLNELGLLLALYFARLEDIVRQIPSGGSC